MAKKPVGEMIISLDLDPTSYTAAQKKILAGAKEATGSIDANWKKLASNSDAYYDAMRRSFVNSQRYIIQQDGVTADTIYRSRQALNAKLAALDQEQFAHKYAAAESEKVAAQAAVQAKLAITEKENNANAQYWLARRKFEKEALAQSVLDQKKASEAAIALREKENLANQQYWTAKMAYDKKAAAESVAAQATAEQQARSMGLMQIAAIKENADRTKAIQDKAAQDALVPWQTLGIRSQAVIRQQVSDVKAAAVATQATVQKGSQDWINIERAKNAKLKELNREMVGEHDWSMAAMMRTVLRYYAAWYVISNAIKVAFVPLEKGFKAVEEYNTSVASMAAMVVTFGNNVRGLSLEDQWKGALKYSTAIIPVLEKIAAKTLLSGQETIALANAFARSGVFLDENNKKQIDSFTRISNALPLMTQGQEITRQINTEIRALMTGMNEQSSMMLITLKAIDPQIEKHLAQWRAEDTVLEHIGELLKGFGPATEILEKQWTAVKTTLDTTVTQILRASMKPAYESIIESVKELDSWLNANKKTISDTVVEIYAIGKALKTVYGVIPEGLLTAVGSGILFKLLFGSTPVGAATTVLILANQLLERINMNIGSMPKKISDLNQSIKNMINGPKKDDGSVTLYWDNSALTAQEKANLAVVKIMKQMDEAILKGHKETIAEFDKVTKDQVDAFRKSQGGVGATDLFINEYLKKRNVLKEQQFQLDKKADDAAKKAAEAAKKAAEELEKAIERNLEQLTSSYAKHYDNRDKLAKEHAKASEDYEKETAKQTIKTWTDATKEAIEAMEKDIALGVKQTMDSLSRPQKEADEARKMVMFYQDMIGMEDEYRQAKLDWIEKEANVKFAGMDKELLKERWMKEQRIKFEQEISDAKAKQIQQALGDMSSMFNSLSGMYDKNSGEYARLQEAANAMIILQKAVAVVNAVSAVAAAAAAPFPAGFVAMASMAAAMGSLLGSIGLSVGGGLASAPSAAYGQNTTVFGGANNEGSQSIQKSWELLQDTYKMENTKLTGIYNEMKQLNDNITGIVRGIVQGDMGLMSVGTGYSQSGIANLFNGILKTASNLATLASGVIIAGSAYMGVLAASAAAGPVGWAVMAALVVDKVLGLGIVDKVIGGISNFIFGSSTTTQTASGIMVGGGVVSPYTQTLTEKKGMFGGLFGGGGSSVSRTIYEANATLTNLFYGPNGIYTTLKSSVTSMATLLGADIAKAESKVFEAFELNFIGKTADQIQEMVSAKISEIGDTFAREVFGGLIDTYQKVGEGALETVSRLAVDMVVVSDLIAMTGKSFSGTNESIIALSESLIELAGGLDKLQEAASTYYDKFFSDEEKQLRLQGQLTQAMAAHNLPLMETRTGYRALVEALDLTVEWQREAYVTMLLLAEGADQYYSYLEDALIEATNAQNDYIESLKAISQTIDQWLANLSLSTLSPVQSEAEWTRQYMEAKTKASLSGASEQDVNDYLSFATKYLEMQQKYGTSDSYRAIYDAVISDVTGMQAGKNLALDLAQRQLDALNAIAKNTAATAAATAVTAVTAISGNINMAELPPEQIAATIENINTVDWAKVSDEMQRYNDLFPPPDPWYSGPYASGGYADRPSIFGEAGGEWAVPVREPQRRNFLKSAPKEFWDNLGLNGGSDGPGGEVTVHSHIYLDGKEIQTCISKGFKTNSDLIQSARRAVN